MPTGRPLTGEVRLDAAYMVERGAGSLVDGHVALRKGNLLSDAGTGLLSDLGAGLLTDNGTGIISNNSGGIVSNNSGGYRLLQAELLPIQGLAIVPIDLARGQPLGRVFYTDAGGRFEVRIPADFKGNLALAGLVPGSQADDPLLADPRLQWGLVVASDSTAHLDDDTALVGLYIRSCFANALETAFGSDDLEATLARIGGARTLTGPLKEALSGLVRELRQAAREAGVDQLAADQRARLARRVSASVLAHVALAELKLDAALSPGWTGPAEPALPAMAAILRTMRERCAAILEADPRAFDGKPYLEGTRVRRPADLGEFVVRHYLLSADSRALLEAGMVMDDVGMRRDPETGLDQEQRLRAAYYATVGAIGQTLALDEAARADAFAAIAGAGK